MYYSLLNFTIEDFLLIPMGFWIGLVIIFPIIYFFVYKHFTKQLLEKELEQERDNDFF